jgi:hypothetical protein
MLVRRRNFSETGLLGDDTGWFGSKIVKSVVSAVPGGGAISAVAKGIASGQKISGIFKSAATSAIPGGELTGSALRSARNIARGGNVSKSVFSAAAAAIPMSARPTVAKVSAVAKRVSSGENLANVARSAGGEEIRFVRGKYGKALASVPVVGTAASIGLGTAANLSRGQSLQQSIGDAALESLPGGAITRGALRAGIGVARGQNVIQTVGREGITYAAENMPGGELGRRGFNAALNVARGGNVVTAVGREGLALARENLPVPSLPANIKNVVSSVTSNLPKVPMNLTRPNYGMPASVSPENVARVRQVAFGMRRPNMRPQVISGVQREASFRPLSTATRGWLVRGLPHMRGEVSGLSETGAQWIVETGDTGSKIALKLTGNASRWTELRAVNPKIMARGADLVKKYGFPIYVRDLVNLPASWIKVVAKTPAQAAPATPAATTPPPVVMPAGNIAAQGQARTILAAWGKTDGKNEASVPDYGNASELQATMWTGRDVLQGSAFASWWRRNGGPPAVDDGNWSDNLSMALNRWAEGKANQVQNTALAGGGLVIPPILTPPAVAAPKPVPAGPTASPWPEVVTQAAPPGSTPTQITLPPVTMTPIVATIPQVPGPAFPATVSAPAAPAPSQQANAAPQAARGMTEGQKWGLGSIAAGTILSTIIRLMV